MDDFNNQWEDSHFQELSATRAAQVDSVLRTVGESREKIKISLMLPKIFEHVDQLPQYLNGTEYESCIQVVEEFLKRRDVMVRGKFATPLDYHVIKLIDYFHENYKIMKYLPNWLDDLRIDEKTLLDAFSLLHDIAATHLRKSSKYEMAKERKLHQIYHENESIKKNIVDLKTKLHNQKINLRWKMAAKEVYLQKFEDDLAYKKWDNSMRIQQEIVKCSRLIRQNHAASVAKQKELEEEMEKTRAEYEKITKQNLAQEKEARAEKNKLLLQLQGLIKKYDQTIGEKMKENLYLQEEYAEQKKKLDDFMVIYQREEIQYDQIVLKKEEEERREQQQRVILFMMNRAARIIQRYWRRYRREQRKKAKKGKGKGKKK